MFTILTENLAVALKTAIDGRRIYEKEQLQYTRDSALVAGWVEVLKAIYDGEEIEVKRSE